MLNDKAVNSTNKHKNPSENTITIHMDSILDGFIAKKYKIVSWLETSSNNEKGITLSPQDQEKFLKTIDCYVMGSRTYELALELSKSYVWAYGDVPTFVVTNRKLTLDRKNIEFYSGDINKLVNERLKTKLQEYSACGRRPACQGFYSFKTGRRYKAVHSAYYFRRRNTIS